MRPAPPRRRATLLAAQLPRLALSARGGVADAADFALENPPAALRGRRHVTVRSQSRVIRDRHRRSYSRLTAAETKAADPSASCADELPRVWSFPKEMGHLA